MQIKYAGCQIKTLSVLKSYRKAISDRIHSFKFILSILSIMLHAVSVSGQTDFRSKQLAETRTIYNHSTNAQERLDAALTIINRYAGAGGAFDDTAQQLIYIAREFNQAEPNDTVNYYLQNFISP